MPKQKMIYKCDFCNKMLMTLKGIEKHEIQCLKNPNTYNCFMCTETTIESEWDLTKDVPVCHFYEEIISQNTAMHCENYRRCNESIYERRLIEESREISNNQLKEFGIND